MRYLVGFCLIPVLAWMLFIVIICVEKRDFVVRGAPADASCAWDQGDVYRCISDQTVYTCVRDNDSGSLHLVLDCAPLKGYRQ